MCRCCWCSDILVPTPFTRLFLPVSTLRYLFVGRYPAFPDLPVCLSLLTFSLNTLILRCSLFAFPVVTVIAPTICSDSTLHTLLFPFWIVAPLYSLGRYYVTVGRTLPLPRFPFVTYGTVPLFPGRCVALLIPDSRFDVLHCYGWGGDLQCLHVTSRFLFYVDCVDFAWALYVVYCSISHAI